MIQLNIYKVSFSTEYGSKPYLVAAHTISEAIHRAFDCDAEDPDSEFLGELVTVDKLGTVELDEEHIAAIYAGQTQLRQDAERRAAELQARVWELERQMASRVSTLQQQLDAVTQLRGAWEASNNPEPKEPKP